MVQDRCLNFQGLVDMREPLSLAGQKYGKLTIIGRIKKHHLRTRWECLCDCGNIKIIDQSSIRNGHTKSCGCLKKERLKGNTNNKVHGMKGTIIYQTWRAMKQRCTNKGHVNYHNYGGRGISICDRWLESFESFYEDMGERPTGKTLDRIDSNGNYCKENCKWSTKKEQCINRRNPWITRRANNGTR